MFYTITILHGIEGEKMDKDSMIKDIVERLREADEERVRIVYAFILRYLYDLRKV